MAGVKKSIEVAGWKLTEELRAWVRFKYPRVDVDDEAEYFVDYWTSNGKAMASWDATFKVWVRRSLEFRRGNGNSRAVAVNETPFFSGERTPGPPVQIRDHPLFRKVK